MGTNNNTSDTGFGPFEILPPLNEVVSNDYEIDYFDLNDPPPPLDPMTDEEMDAYEIDYFSRFPRDEERVKFEEIVEISR